ncbi:MAG: GNAT family N-acetyltransferase [Acidimicrobiales bacterium]
MIDAAGLTYRPMIASDLGQVPIGHQGDEAEVAARIADLGASAILCFDGAQHVGQLQFRRYQPSTVSPDGLLHPLYWADFNGFEPFPPAAADRSGNSGDPGDETPVLAVFCYHVGQLDDTDVRDERYQGKGVGAALLDSFLTWADTRGATVVAKYGPPHRAVLGYLGAQPLAVYEARGFRPVASWVDTELRAKVLADALVPEGVTADDAATVGCCVRPAARRAELW